MLAERRLKKGDLSDLSGVRAGTISAVANSPTSPEVDTLQRLLDGFTKFDQSLNPNAPAVCLWEFFVSDEQAALLRQAEHSRQQAIKQEDLVAQVVQRLGPIVASLVQDATASPSQPAASPAASSSQATLEHPPADALARGKLQHKRKRSA
jgi:hypothetical protein